MCFRQGQPARPACLPPCRVTPRGARGSTPARRAERRPPPGRTVRRKRFGPPQFRRHGRKTLASPTSPMSGPIPRSLATRTRGPQGPETKFVPQTPHPRRTAGPATGGKEQERTCGRRPSSSLTQTTHNTPTHARRRRPVVTGGVMRFRPRLAALIDLSRVFHYGPEYPHPAGLFRGARLIASLHPCGPIPQTDGRL